MPDGKSNSPRRARNAIVATFFAILLIAPAASAMSYGIDLKGYGDAKASGWTPKYGQFWIGPWSANNWGYLDSSLKDAKAKGVTPVIEWYYWGDAISPNCVKHGCNGLSQGKWNSMGAELAKRVRTHMGNAPVIIVVETEFNKGGVQTWEEFDGILASHIGMIKGHAPNAKIALGFGNWGSENWGRFDRAMAKSEYGGLQLMRGITKDSWASYKGAPDALLNGAKAFKAKFGKPIIVHDIALASYNAGSLQDEVIKGLRDRKGSLEAAGVFALVYREARDYAGACTCWYYGPAEKTFGLKTSGGGAKAAWWTWVNMAKGGSSSSPPATSPPSSGSGLSATFTPQNGNAWWVQVKVTASKSLSGVDVRVNGGSWIALQKQSYGWTKSMHVPNGATVEFRAKATDGSTAQSGKYTWPAGSAASTGGSTTFTPQNGNTWWVQVKVTSSKSLTGVDARVNGGSWKALDKHSYGWAKSIHAPAGSVVEFRAKATDGSIAYSAKYVWPK